MDADSVLIQAHTLVNIWTSTDTINILVPVNIFTLLAFPEKGAKRSNMLLLAFKNIIVNAHAP